MRLWLADRLLRENITPESFFRSAYIWRFGKIVDISRDVLEYKVAGIVPIYVEAYIQHIQRKERGDAVQTL